MSNSRDTAAISEEILEEFATGALRGRARARLEERIQADPVLRGRAAEAVRRVRELKSALAGAAEGAPGTPCLGGEELALWLGRALPGEAARQVEQHLGGCAACRRRAVELYRETKAASRPDALLTDANGMPVMGRPVSGIAHETWRAEEAPGPGTAEADEAGREKPDGGSDLESGEQDAI